MRTLAPSILILLLAAAPLAAAQSANPTFTVTITGAPETFPDLESNATATAEFQVEVVLSNVVCTGNAVIPVTLTATPAGAPAFFTATPEPAMLNFTVSAGPHGSGAVGSPAGGSQAAIVRVTTTEVTANATVPVELVATATAPAECRGASQLGTATSEPVAITANVVAPPPPPVEEPPQEDTPGFGLIAALAALGAVALLRRRS